MTNEYLWVHVLIIVVICALPLVAFIVYDRIELEKWLDKHQKEWDAIKENFAETEEIWDSEKNELYIRSNRKIDEAYMEYITRLEEHPILGFKAFPKE